MTYIILNGTTIEDVVAENVAGAVEITDEQQQVIAKSKYGHAQFQYMNGELVQDDAFIAMHELSVKRATASLSRKGFFLGLEAMGFYDTVMALKDDPTTPKTVKIEIETATSFDRMYPSVISMAAKIEATEAQLDTLFEIV